MTIQYCSDLHLEFNQNKEFLKRNPLQVKGDILVLAGDIVPFSIMDKHKDFFSFAADNFQYTYWLPGNHEYYHSDISVRSGILHEKIKNNVFLVNNTVAEHENVQLIFSTLWSKINPNDEWHIERSMNDFNLIRYKSYRLSSPVYNQLHLACLAFLQQAINTESAQKKVVVTHHVPTFMHYPPQYKGDILNQAFAVELYDIIESSAISYWLYGHHHTNTPAFKIGNTLLLTNQLGYVHCNEHTTFMNNKNIII